MAKGSCPLLVRMSDKLKKSMETFDLCMLLLEGPQESGESGGRLLHLSLSSSSFILARRHVLILDSKSVD